MDAEYSILEARLAETIRLAFEMDDSESIVQIAADGERTLIDGHFDLRRIARQIIKAMDFSAKPP